MNYGKRDAIQFMANAAQSCQRLLGLQQILGGDSANGEDDFGLNQLNLPLQKGMAGSYFLGLRIAITGRSAFEDIGDVNLLALQTDGAQHFVEQLPGDANERLALQVLVLPRCLTNQQPVGVVITNTEYGLGSGFTQWAGAALTDLILQILPAGSVGV